MQSSDHIQIILKVVKDSRKTADQIIDDLLLSAKVVAAEFLVELARPRNIQSQQ